MIRASRTGRRIGLWTSIVASVLVVGAVGLVAVGSGDTVEQTSTAGAEVVAYQPIDPAALPTESCIADLACLRQHYQTLTYQLGPVAALDALVEHASRSEKLDDNCHDTTHAIGEIAAVLQPMQEAMSIGDEDCGSGYYHGVIATMTVRVPIETLPALLNQQCAVGPRSFKRWECFHGVGHGFVFAANGDIYRGITICESIADDSDKGACASGAFMQELVDHGEDAKYDADPYVVCRAMHDELIAGQCYDMLANIVMIHRDSDAERFAVCTTIGPNSIDCYRGLGRARFSGMPFTGPEIEAFCNTAGSWRDLCLEGAIVNTAAYYGSSEEAATHCVELSTEALQRFCRETLATAGV